MGFLTETLGGVEAHGCGQKSSLITQVQFLAMLPTSTMNLESDFISVPCFSHLKMEMKTILSSWDYYKDQNELNYEFRNNILSIIGFMQYSLIEIGS